ncbi:hypothetical protein CRM22_006078 [Opisthorchis felineus]|uniref:Cadherin domain-containing protein n=1 Tax=Opisthorchis felineus TaxID=147828 RepID=A0A4S2LMR9_OPIFE|nr:hypothetical protein CRM22_006078 [Opisthorchis felineus]
MIFLCELIQQLPINLVCLLTCLTNICLVETTSIVPSSHIHFYLSDNTPANQLVGNVRQAVRLNQSLMRIVLKPDNLFRVNSQGELFTREPIDRDTVCARMACCAMEVCQYQMDAYLFQHQPTTPTTARILVSIADENDNAPVFMHKSIKAKDSGNTDSPAYWELKIPESTPVGSQYALPTATDLDSKRFGLKGYRLLQTDSVQLSKQLCYMGFSPFSLNYHSELTSSDDSHTPNLRVDQTLDREMCGGYDLYMVAEDAGEPPLSSVLHIHVTVLDVNDCPPVFLNISSVTELDVTIPENISVGTVIYRFHVEDPDEGINGIVFLSIDLQINNQATNKTLLDQISSKYTIRSSTGEVCVARELDYENEFERRLVLLVRASDRGAPSLTSTASLTIHLVDVNDNAPRIEVTDAQPQDTWFHLKRHYLLRENDPEPHLLKLISVTDLDEVSVDKISCALEGGYSQDFELRPYSNSMYGLLNLHAFDYEEDSDDSGELSLIVQCTDNAAPKMTTVERIRISLGDDNDNWPKFTQSHYEFYISEDFSVGRELGRVLASDADSGPRGKLTYALSPVTVSSDKLGYNDTVTIDSATGVLSLSQPLDREQRFRMDFEVTVSDCISNDCVTEERKTNTTRVIIFVLDVNDNPPVYTGPNPLYVSEDAPVGTVIVEKMLFHDPDLGKNGTFDISFLEVRRSSGHVITEEFSLDLQAVDRNIAWYSSPVKLDNSSGLIIVRPLDRERESTLLIKILAVDRGDVVRFTTTTNLILHIDDVNDNLPELIFPRNGSVLPGSMTNSDWSEFGLPSLALPVDTTWGTVIVTVRGKDADAGANGSVTYHIVPFQTSSEHTTSMDNRSATYGLVRNQNNLQFPDASRYFKINKITGQLQTYWGESASPRVRATNSTTSSDPTNMAPPEIGCYVLLVELRDGGRPPLSSTAVFYVNISEPIQKYFGYYLFSGMNISNVLIMCIIVSCSVILIISLIGAIFWVRLRKNTPLVNGVDGETSVNSSVKHLPSGPHVVPLMQAKRISNYELDQEMFNRDCVPWRPDYMSDFPVNSSSAINFSPHAGIQTNFCSRSCGCAHGGTLFSTGCDPTMDSIRQPGAHARLDQYYLDEASHLYGIADPNAVPSLLYQSEPNYFENAHYSMGGTTTNSNNGGSDSGIDSGTGFVASVMTGTNESTTKHTMDIRTLGAKPVFSVKTMNC